MAKHKPEIPCFGQVIHETHCHLDYLENGALEEVLATARAVGVDRIITIAVSPDNLAMVRAIAARYPGVYCTQGIHPHDANGYSDTVDAQIRAALSEQQTSAAEKSIVAVGEIGLDYYYDHSDRKIQRQAFQRQLQIAIEYHLPVVIHARDADKDTADILKEMAPELERKGVIHSFTAGIPLAEVALELGFYLGFNGIVTFNKAENVREVLSMTPVDRILLETDAPYLTPVPYRGITNEPKYLPFVAQQVSEVKAIEVATLIQRTTQNAEQLFWADRIIG
jgi:TatD DNase family protein